MRHILGIVLSLMMPLSAWSQQVDLANVVAIADGDLNDDGSRDRAALVSRDGDLDLYVFLSADAPDERVLAGKADSIGFAGRAWPWTMSALGRFIPVDHELSRPSATRLT